MNLSISRGNIERIENLDAMEEVEEVAKEKDQGLKEEFRGQEEVEVEIIVIGEKKIEGVEIEGIEIGVLVGTEELSDLVGIENVEAEKKEVAVTVVANVIVEITENLNLNRIQKIVLEDVTHKIDTKELILSLREIGIEGEDKDLILKRKKSVTSQRIVKKDTD